MFIVLFILFSFIADHTALRLHHNKHFSTSIHISKSNAKKNSEFQLRMNSVDDETASKDPLAAFIGGLGVAANFVIDYSLYVIKTTGCNIVPKFEIEGLLLEQGVSTSLVVGIFVWSLYKKVKTGSGLPAGPAGLLGASEGLSFLTVLGGIIVIALNFSEYGSLTSSTACNSLEYTKPLGFI